MSCFFVCFFLHKCTELRTCSGCIGLNHASHVRNRRTLGVEHRYLMSRLSLQVFYLWRHVLSTAPPCILWWSNLEILFAPLHRSSPFIGGLPCQAIQTEHGPYTVYQKEPKEQSTVLYIVRCLWCRRAAWGLQVEQVLLFHSRPLKAQGSDSNSLLSEV
jgi:hypothetical protein